MGRHDASASLAGRTLIMSHQEIFMPSLETLSYAMLMNYTSFSITYTTDIQLFPVHVVCPMCRSFNTHIRLHMCVRDASPRRYLTKYNWRQSHPK